MDVSKTSTGQVEKSSSHLKIVPTGLFLSWKKSSLLIDVVKEMLKNRYNTVPTKGPWLCNDTCQIYLQAFNSSPACFAQSQELLEKYLHLIEESQPGTVIKKQTAEVVDLANDDDEISYVVLDETVVDNVTLSTDLHQTADESVTIIDLDDSVGVGTSKLKGFNVSSDCDIENTKAAKEDTVGEIIIIDPVKENRSPSQNFPQRVAAVGTSQESEPKRKRYMEPVVEILDDDVIVLDEMPCVPRTDTVTSRVCNNDNVSNTRVTLNGENKRVQLKPTTKPVNEGINLLNVTTPPAVIQIDDNDDDKLPGHSRLQSYIPPMKKSKLVYKRTAHLVDSLTKGSTNNWSETISDTIFNPNPTSAEKRTGLRPIVIDGSNVAITHGEFSLKKLQICINYFEKRGHRQIKAFLPQHRINRDTFEGLNLMERQGTVVFTPSRRVNGKRVTSYDDRFIVQYASEFGGVIVTTDNYRDLLEEDSSWKETIEQRILMFSWVDDVLMFPKDPLGRHGPTLEQFLKFPD
uniref:RNase NYN domain-containing protein n=2 Tax=Graphocephala atropunctata TaxID=36148 RepID=A0A1B6LR90_9HEMI